jgi:Sec-independent protein secretion pathway component TatC
MVSAQELAHKRRYAIVGAFVLAAIAAVRWSENRR